MVNEGRKIRNNSRFIKEGTNVNFVEIKKDALLVRTYERGVENETLACGTGVTAVAIAAELKKNNTNKNGSKIEAMGGHLEISYECEQNKFSNVWLKGPAELVFRGELKLGNTGS